jgi:hypothetical protein
MPQAILICTDTATVPEETNATATFICSECEKMFDKSQMKTFDNVNLCNECFNNLTVICDNCRTTIWDEDSCHDDYTCVCPTCYEHFYRRCNDCECLVHVNSAFYYDDEAYCEDCYNDIEDRDDNYDDEDDENAIHSYYYKPKPVFYGEGIHYGIELEVDGAGEKSSNAWDVLDVGNYVNDHIYIKHDGSLSDGFEIVSHPMSLEYHQDKMNWKELMGKLIGLGYRSHKTDTCGYHIHVEKAKLGNTDEQQETTISNILYFVEKHWNELLKFSRRTPKQMRAWASRYGYKDSPKEIMHYAKSGTWSRYVCVNLQNTHRAC